MSPRISGATINPQCVIAVGWPCSWRSEKSCGCIALVKPTERRERSLPSFAESQGCKPVDECMVGTLSVALAPGLRSRSRCFCGVGRRVCFGGFRPTKRVERYHGHARGDPPQKKSRASNMMPGSGVKSLAVKTRLFRLLVGRDDDFLSDEYIVGVFHAVPIGLVNFLPLVHRIIKSFGEFA